MKIYDWDTAVGALRAVLLMTESRLPPGDVESIWGLVDAGELGVAFENLCEQLYEYEVPIEEGTVQQLQELGTYLDVNSQAWQRLIGQP